jgi:hypothetical protein
MEAIIQLSHRPRRDSNQSKRLCNVLNDPERVVDRHLVLTQARVKEARADG